MMTTTVTRVMTRTSSVSRTLNSDGQKLRNKRPRNTAACITPALAFDSDSESTATPNTKTTTETHPNIHLPPA
eukprot:872183-Rhodomonas_salina.1